MIGYGWPLKVAVKVNRMVEKRFWKNFALIFIGLLICVSIWQKNGEQTLTKQEVLARDNKIQFYQPNTVNSTYYHPLDSLSSNDYTQIMNLKHFRFNVLANSCDADTFLLIAVHSAPYNFARRRIIRKTWGDVTGNVIKIIFMVGEIENSTLQEDVLEETYKYNDMVHGEFRDAYRNLTYKHMMSLKFAIYHCPRAKYVLKLDDDVMVNIPTLLDFLRNDISAYGAKKLLLCTPRKNLKVIRTYRSKWRVSFAEYPYKYYPTYCPGWAVLYSPDVLFELYAEAQNMQYFWIDDVFLTGLVATRIGVKHTNVESLVLDYWNLRKIDNGYADYNSTSPFLYSMPDLDPVEVLNLWHFVKGQYANRNYVP